MGADQQGLEKAIVWLEDMPEEIQDHISKLKREGFSILAAQDFVQLDEHLKTVMSNRAKIAACVIILDIMLETVSNLSAYYPSVRNARTVGGYAAGLIFLERVLTPNEENRHIYRAVSDVPVILYSKRTLTAEEKSRVEALEKQSGRPIRLAEKATLKSMRTFISDVLGI